MGIVGQDRGIAVAVGDEHRHVEGADPLQQTVIRDPAGAYRVVLRLSGLPGCGLVSIFGPGREPSEGFLARLAASGRAVKNTLTYPSGLGLVPPTASITSGAPAVHAGRALGGR